MEVLRSMMTPSVSVVTQIQLGVTGGMMMMPVVGETRVMWTKMVLFSVQMVKYVRINPIPSAVET